MTGIRCFGACMKAIEVVVVENTIKYWSNTTSWPSGVLPVEGEDVEILTGWNMFLDLVETPKLNSLTINGRLTFLQDRDIHLQAKRIFVRAGELLIGSETEPFRGNALITLHGVKQDEHMVFTASIEAGNKILANTGKVEMYGKKRLNYLARLTDIVMPGNQ